MASNAYMNTYQTYEAGTTKIATWLIESARRCGVDVEELITCADGATTGPSPKSKKSKFQSPSKSTTHHVIPLKDSMTTAVAISASRNPVIRLSSTIETLIRAVIKLRKQATAFFVSLSKHRESSTQGSDARHQYFVSVLERVLITLKGTPNDDATGHDSIADTGNIFEALPLDDDQGDDADEDEVATMTTEQPIP